MLLLSKIGLIDYKMLAKTRKYSIIIILIIGAILTPPDVISQITLSILLYLLFELVILFVFISNKFKKIKN
jgi:sec-independent protein translocase protein TatC